MNTKYRYKPLEIEAMQFVATPQGIADIALFAGADFTGVNLNGNPLPAAFVAGFVVPEGSWIIRNATGMYKVLKDNVFTAVCEPAPAAMQDIYAAASALCPEIASDDIHPAPALVSLEYARANGLKRYADGKACPHGHTTERYVSTQGCVTCAYESAKNTRKKLAKRVKQREYSARYYAKQREIRAVRGATSGIFAPLAATLSMSSNMRA